MHKSAVGKRLCVAFTSFAEYKEIMNVTQGFRKDAWRQATARGSDIQCANR